MNILGYSGLHNSLAFREKNLEGLTSQEYRMCQGLDSAACVIVDGEIIAAAEEERFTGEKFTCDFPINAITYCLQAANLSIDDIDRVCHGFDYSAYEKMYALKPLSMKFYQEVLSPEAQMQHFKPYFPSFPVRDKFVPVSHHIAHAASTFYPSGFDDALIVIADGLGEENGISILEGKDNKITLLKEHNIFSSLGILYSQITAHLGFLVNSDEYKVMGLAPYGDSSVYDSLFNDIIDYLPNGELIINAYSNNKTQLEKETFRGFKRWLADKTFAERLPDMPIEQKHKDLAATLQAHLEKAMMHVILYWKERRQANNLCLAGGVALNCVCNGLILKEQHFDRIYIPPSASDAGTSLGAALVELYATEGRLIHTAGKELPYYGPDLTETDCQRAIAHFDQEIVNTHLADDVIYQVAADYIGQGKVIGWAQGRMEFGPRALGNRSILADPAAHNMRDKINSLVKKRESFRPFAPAVIAEQAGCYFEIPKQVELPYMLFTVDVKPEYQAKLPAITHVNGSARVQTVSQDCSPRFWSLIDSLGTKTGMPIVLNTSFNVKGQPIVRTAYEAIETFIDAGLDALFLGNYLIELRK